MFAQDFRKDLDKLFKVLNDPDHPAIAFARFHDGEFALLRGRKYKAVSGWTGDGAKTWLREPLLASLKCELPGYHVGISDITTLPGHFNWYIRNVGAPLSRVTFATLWSYANYRKTLRYFKARRKQYTIVGCTDRCDVRVPANASRNRFDVDEVVDAILDADKPALLVAGPASCLVAHRYWERTLGFESTRKHVLDVGAAIDPIVHGRDTREFHSPKSRLGTFVPAWSGRTSRLRTGRAPRPAKTQGTSANVRTQQKPGETKQERPAQKKRRLDPPSWTRTTARPHQRIRKRR